MRILVTGGAGFIGSHYVRTILAGGYPGYEQAGVTVLDKLTYAGNLANLDPVAGNPRLRFVQGDICDVTLLASLLPGHDAVLNFAAETHVDRSIDGASDFVAANVVGVQVLLQACLDAGVSRVIQVSTDEVYGSIAEGSWTEDAPLAPNSPYSAAKAGGDLMARAYARTHGLNVSITRCCNNYGPYQFPEKIIPLFVTNLLDGLKVPLYGDGGNVRDWIHVDDHCRGIQLVLEQGTAAGVYHINGDAELTNLELTRAILEHCGAGWDMVTPVQDRKGHDRRYSLDDSALRALGYTPRIPFADGLTATVRWYADHRSWWEPLKRAQGEPLPLRSTAGGRAARARSGRPGQARPVSRWLVTGARGMLGRDLVAVLEQRGEAVTGLSRSDLDITDAGAVRDALARWQPAVVVNCAAWTAVDDAETSEDSALRVNGDAVAGLAACCASRGIALVQISTDYVFDGLGNEPYPEDGFPEPRTAYGRTKLAGERAVLEQDGLAGYVVRTAWLYGAHGPSFAATMIRKEREQAQVHVVDDQRGQPTWSVDVADRVHALIASAAEPGIYHATSSGETTWFGLAQEVFRLLGADPARVLPAKSTTLARPAPRPAYSVLGHAAWGRAGLTPIGRWEQALQRGLPGLTAVSTAAEHAP